MELFSPEEQYELHSIVRSGFWRLESEKGKPARLLADDVFDDLLGTPLGMTPEERYVFFNANVHPDDNDMFQGYAGKLMTGARAELTYRYLHPDRGEMLVRCGGMGIPGNPVTVLKGYHQDISDTIRMEPAMIAEQRLAEQKAQLESLSLRLEDALEQAKAGSRAKSTFLFNMSHDIRTPLNAIMGFTELLDRRQDEPEKRQEYIHKIRASSEFLLAILNDVLEMSRIESGKIVLEEQAWSTSQFNDALFSVFHESMRAKNITFTRTIDVQNHYVFCDSIKLREIYLNILSNAGKYTPEGGHVSMNLKEIPSGREGYVLYETVISDDGIGMSQEFLPHLFDEFTREEGSYARGVQGTGLGMAIVKSLVDLMGGTIEVESQLGVGTTFTIRMPHRIATESDLHVAAKADCVNSCFVGKRILLAEDNDLNAEIAMEILKGSGLIVDRAEDGMKCFKRIQEVDAGYYNLILMDIQMPQMNGYEATEAIRALDDPIKSRIPILAMTANAFDEDKRNAEQAGMNAHLSKPINIDKLISTLSLFL